MKTLHFAGVLPPASTVVREWANTTDRVYHIQELQLIYLVGQAGTLFCRPQLRQISGSLINLLFPDPELTGDDHDFTFRRFDLAISPGASVVLAYHNTDTVNSRRYHAIVDLGEVL